MKKLFFIISVFLIISVIYSEDIRTLILFNVINTYPEIDEPIYWGPLYENNYIDVNYEVLTIVANISDEEEVGATCNLTHGCAWINITLPDSSHEIINLTVNQTISNETEYKYSFIGNYTATQTGIHHIWIYAKDAQGLLSKSLDHIFNTTDITQVNLVTNISRDIYLRGECFNQTFTLYNVGDGGAYYINVSVENLPNNWTSVPLGYNYTKLIEGNNVENTFLICASEESIEQYYYFNLSLNWTNPDNSTSVLKKTINVTLHPEWDLSPELLNKTVGCNSSWSLGRITITVDGTRDLNFTNNCSGDICSYLSYPENIFVFGNSEAYFAINYTLSGNCGNYSGNLTIISTTNLSNPKNLSISLYLQTAQFELFALNYTNETNSSEWINLLVNLTYNNTSVNNSEFEVIIGGVDCSNLTSTYINTTAIWNIICLSPNHTDGFYYDLDIKANTTIDNTPMEVGISNSNTIYYYDISPPVILSTIYLNTEIDEVALLANVTIKSNISDVTGVENVTININFSTYILSNITENVTNTTWVVEIQNMSKGDYDYNLTAEDFSGYGDITDGWFEVFEDGVFLTGNSTNSEDVDYATIFEFYRNTKNFSEDYKINCNFTVEGYYSEEIHNRTYDLKFIALDNTVRLKEVIINENITNPIRFDEWGNLTTTVFSYPGANGIVHFERILGISSNLNFLGDGDMQLYLENNEAYDYSIHKCSDWDFYNRTCSGGWVRISDTSKTTNTIFFNISGFSAYGLGKIVCTEGYKDCGGTCYRNEDCVYCCNGVCSSSACVIGDTGGTGGSDSSSSTDSIPDSVSAICGNGICETGEFWENCPEDCSPQIPSSSITSNIIDARLHPGDSKTYSIWLTNNLAIRQNALLSVSGSVWEYIQLEQDMVTVDPMSTKTIKLKFATQVTTQPGIYTGDIMIMVGNKSHILPVTLTVVPEAYALMDVKVEALTKQVIEDGVLRYHVSLYSLGIKKRFDVTLQYQIKEIDTDRLISQNEETLAIETSLSFIRNYDFANVSITPGKYFISVVAKYENKTATSADLFEVIMLPWWSVYTPWILLAVIIIISLVLIMKYYRKRLLGKLRYLTPVDYKSLPSSGFKMGKIAETDKDAYIVSDDLMTHVISAGATGAGKTVSSMVIAEECLKEKIPVIVFDPTAQWTGFVKPNRDVKMLSKYKEFGLKEEDARSFPGMIYEVVDPNAKLDLRKYMNPGEITIFTLNRLKPREYDLAVQNIVNTIFEQGWEESGSLKMLIVFDEVHRLLERYGGKGGYVMLEKAAREFRKWGLGVLMISQVLSDFKEALKGNVLTEIQLNTKALNDLKRSKEKYGIEYSRRITKEEVGVGMIQNPKYNQGKPYWISFRPLLHSPHKIPNKELLLYSVYNLQLDLFEKKIIERKETGKDIFDLELELKLAKEKLKGGKFRMAEIYINSLKSKLGL